MRKMTPIVYYTTDGHSSIVEDIYVSAVTKFL